jgi:hypothetical protein
MEEGRECPHTFYCWYRIDGRCCHSCVVDIASCQGHEPASIYVKVTKNLRRELGLVDSPRKQNQPTSSPSLPVSPPGNQAN